MLYVTTRINRDAFTAHRALTEQRGPEGGLYLPMRMPKFSQEQICGLGNRSFGENVADILNLLFNTRLSGWDVEFAVGRHSIKLVSLNSKAAVAETWHNPDWRFERMARNLCKAVRQTDEDCKVTDWMMIAARIAVLFGIFGELLRTGQVTMDAPIDVALPSGDFSAPMAAWYAREWGLPIRQIVCCCNENSAPWSLLHQGDLRTDGVAVRTATPNCDQAVPADLERLVYSTLGYAQTKRYCEACRQGGTYHLEGKQLQKLRQGLYVSVVSQRRLESMIPNIYHSNGYIPDPYTALAYSGLIDYRSRTGENRPALILAEESPAFSLDTVAACLGITTGELKDRINKS